MNNLPCIWSLHSLAHLLTLDLDHAAGSLRVGHFAGSGQEHHVGPVHILQV
jgi:hypothetical protein